MVGPTAANELGDPTRKSISLEKCRTVVADRSGATRRAAAGRCAAERLGYATVDSHAEGEFFSPRVASEAYQYVIGLHAAFLLSLRTSLSTAYETAPTLRSAVIVRVGQLRSKKRSASARIFASRLETAEWFA